MGTSDSPGPLAEAHLTRSGGIAGIRETVAVTRRGARMVADVRPFMSAAREVELDAATEAELERACMALLRESTRPPRQPAGADRFVYELEVHAGGRRAAFTATDPLPDSPLGDAARALARLLSA